MAIPYDPPFVDPTSNKERVRHYLKLVGKTGPFNAVDYDADADEMRIATDATVTPAEVIVQETNAGFGVPIRNRRYSRQEKLEWRWAMQLGFNVEVSLEEFEENLTERSLIIPSDDDAELRQVTLELLDVSYQHPPEQDPNVGTRAIYTFRAVVAPV